MGLDSQEKEWPPQVGKPAGVKGFEKKKGSVWYTIRVHGYYTTPTEHIARGDFSMKIGGKEVFLPAGRPWDGMADHGERGRSITGSDPREIVEICLTCKRPRCERQCQALDHKIREYKQRQKRGGA